MKLSSIKFMLLNNSQGLLKVSLEIINIQNFKVSKDFQNF